MSGQERGSSKSATSESSHKDEFLSLAAHEIRTPITVIKAQAQLAELLHRQGRFEGEVVERTLKSFVRESDRLARLCNDLLDVARLDSGTLEVRCVSFNVTAELQAIVSRFNQKAELHRVELIFCETELYAFADPQRAEQVLGNLLHNAIRYSPQGGSVVVSVSTAKQNDGEVEISVTDQGLGIAEDKISSIFQRYYRAHQRGLKGPCGLGIGLYLCREILEKMGGSIQVKSDGIGKGARFSFYLPKERNQK